jgi:hypothetical protein
MAQAAQGNAIVPGYYDTARLWPKPSLKRLSAALGNAKN